MKNKEKSKWSLPQSGRITNRQAPTSALQSPTPSGGTRPRQSSPDRSPEPAVAPLSQRQIQWAARRELLQLSVLRYCTFAGSMGLRTDFVLDLLRADGRRGLTEAGLREELRDLEVKGYLRRKPLPPLLGPDCEIWEITLAGVAHIAATELLV